MGLKTFAATAALLFFVTPFVLSQSKDTGAIEGTVIDAENASLPGVAVTLTSPNLMGTRSALTDANGLFRFPALPPGTYAVKAEMPGFRTVIREGIRLTTTTRLTVGIVLQQASVAEEVTVVGEAPTVDVKSTESASVTLSNEILRNIPYNQFTANIVNLAPGVTDNSAYGASQDTGIAYSMDGVNVSDPEGGSAWVFLDHNIIEEAKIMGLGLPAEYGNFTGVIFNLVTKSGGNAFSGHFEFDFQGKPGEFPKGLWQTVNNHNYAADWPDVTSPINKLLDVNGHVGGPLLKDKLWFYVGLQYYETWFFPTGFPEARNYYQPRSFWKLSSQLSPKTNAMFSLEVDTYNGVNRAPFGFSHAELAPESTVSQKSPEVVGSLTLTHILSPKTFLDFKAAYFWGYYYLEPKMGRDVNAHFDINDNKLHDNSYHYYLADRSRFQVNASLTHYAEDFIKGDHDFKFGVELERSAVRSRYGFTGTNHTYYVDYLGYYYAGPQGQYLAYQYEGYDLNSKYLRIEAFAQDSWQVTKRLNLSAGVRFSQNWGFVNGVSGSVYRSSRLAPRIGFTFDVLGDKTTILKAHYGQFTEAMLSNIFDRLSPSAFKPYISYMWDINEGKYVEFERILNTYRLAPGTKHPYMDQFTVSLERELFKDASFSASLVSRRWRNIIGVYDMAADYEQVAFTVPSVGTPLMLYNLVSGNAHDFVLGNIKKGDPWILLDPYRKYWGLELMFNKRFSNKWQFLASYVYGKATGTIDNGQSDDFGRWNSTFDPNFWINGEGHSSSDPTHMIKAQATYVLPFEVNFSVYFHSITGRAWTTRYRTSSSLLNQGRETVFVEPRGSHHYKMANGLDLRLEKTFMLSRKYRLGIILDVFNLLNDDTIDDWGTRIDYDWIPGEAPSTGGHELLSFVDPRAARVGIRLIF
jgi:Carboxypeptidase regulatory-like domain/TonB dependent receptor